MANASTGEHASPSFFLVSASTFIFGGLHVIAKMSISKINI